jgi:transcription antitermination factor NusG
LAWAAREQRILLTHDLKTMPDYAWTRVANGEKMMGVVWVSQSSPIGVAIEDILTIVEVTEPEEWQNMIVYLPLLSFPLKGNDKQASDNN